MKHIVNFQKKYGLQPTGKIGPNTLSKLANVLNIKSKEQLAHFLGQVHHETGGFDNDRESLNYIPQALIKNFPNRITQQQAWEFGRTSEQKANQVAIANIIYGGRWGQLNLGNTQPNDGWDFRGNGSIQTTGRFNHQKLANYIKDPEIMSDPDKLTKDYYFESGIYYFDDKDVWKNCNQVTKNNILLVSKHVNLGNASHRGAPKHLEDREKWTFHYYTLLQNVNIN
jgi:putative chitinase